MTGRLLLLAILILGLQALTRSCSAAVQSGVERGATLGGAMVQSLAEGVRSQLYNQFVPVITFASEKGHGRGWLFWEQIDCVFPFYGYLSGDQWEGETGASDLRTIMLAEAEEGITVPEEEHSDQETQENAPLDSEPAGETLEDLLRAENEAAMQQTQETFDDFGFLPHERQIEVDLIPLRDYETLVRQFYTVDGNTTAGSGDLNVEKFQIGRAHV